MSSTKKAMREVLTALDGWIEGAKSNHEAAEHRNADCCTNFSPEDIRNMVADAARSIEAKKAQKKGRRSTRSPSVLVEIGDGIAGTRLSHVISTGDTFEFNVNGFLVSLDGTKPISRIDVPITIKAHIA